jgi:hypothetical protein
LKKEERRRANGDWSRSRGERRAKGKPLAWRQNKAWGYGEVFHTTELGKPESAAEESLDAEAAFMPMEKKKAGILEGKMTERDRKGR